MNETWWLDPKQLNDEQKSIIELPLSGSHLITGPPGSGKTNLLLLRGNYMTLAGQPNILIVVFTKTLQEFIAAGGNLYAFPQSKIQTSMKWEQSFLRSFGVTSNPPEEFNAKRQFLLEQVQQLLVEGKGQNIYDAVLLDEAQDYLPDEIRVFSQVGRVLFASAHSKQKIYSGEDTVSLLESLTDHKHKLHYHYRIGTKICTLADALVTGDDAEPLRLTSNYDEETRPSSVEFLETHSLEETANTIIEKLLVQVRAYPEELLGVVAPSRSATVHLWERIMESDLAPLSVLQVSGEHAPFSPETRICVSTIHAAKGLEFRALHIAECNDLINRAHERNVTYTAITRAKTSLTLYASSALPGYLEKALTALEPMRDLPNLSAVFRREK